MNAIERFDHYMGRAIEGVAACLMVAETILLLAGVTARYAFHSPIVWSDEMAGSIFLWLGMFGATIALRRGVHLRFGGLTESVGPGTKALLQTFVIVCVVAFLCFLLFPAIEYVEDEAYAVLPNLNVPASWRAVGIVIGIALMLISALIQAVRSTSLLIVGISGALVALVVGAMWLGSSWLIDIGNYNLFVFFVALIGVAILVGVPIGFAFGIATIGYLGFVTTVPLSVIVNRLDQGMSQPLLIAIPMFVFLGLLIDFAGLAKVMVAFLASMLGSVRGGLYYVLLAAMILVSGISGSKVADMAAIAPGLFPEIRRRGANEGDLVALLASSAAMADTIPPSLVLIAFGSVTGISIGALFTAGLIPALVLAAFLAALVFVRSHREKMPSTQRPAWGVIGRMFIKAFPALLLPFVIRWAVVEGVATPTEVSTIGIFYAFVIGMTIYRPLQWSRLYPILLDSAALAGAILFVIGTATGMSWALTQSGFSTDMASVMESLSGNAYGFLAVTAVAFILLGNILEGIPAILLFGPLLLPVSQSFGIHDVQYAIVVVIAMSIGLFAPPFGIGFYAASAIGGVKPEVAARYLWMYLVALIAGLALVAAVPWFSIVLL